MQMCSLKNTLLDLDLFWLLYLDSCINPGNSLINAHSNSYKEHLQSSSYSVKLLVPRSLTGGPCTFNNFLFICLPLRPTAVPPDGLMDWFLYPGT